MKRAVVVLGLGLVACSSAKPSSPPPAKPQPIAPAVVTPPVKRGPPALPGRFAKIDFHTENDDAFVGSVDGGVGDCHALATARIDDFCVRLDRYRGVLRLVFYFESLAEARTRVTAAWGEPEYGAEANESMGTPTLEFWTLTTDGTPTGQRIEARLETAANGPVSLLIRETQSLGDRFGAPPPVGLAKVIGMTPAQLEAAFGKRLYECDPKKMCRVGMPLLESDDSMPMLKMERGKVKTILQGWTPVGGCTDPATLAAAVAAFGASTPHAVVKRPDLTRHSFADAPGVFLDISTNLPGLCRICTGTCDDVKLAK